MNYSFAIFSFIGFIIASFSSIFVLARDPNARLNRMFFIYMGVASLFSLFDALAMISPSEKWALLFYKMAVIMFIFLSVSLYHFLAEYSKRERLIVKYPILHGLLYVPAFILGFISWNTDLFYTGVEITRWGYGQLLGSYYWILATFSTLYILLALYYAWSGWQEAETKRELRQSSLIYIGLLTAFIFGFISAVVLPILGFRPLTLLPISVLLYILFFSMAMVRYGLLVITPASISENVLSTMPDIMVLVGLNKEILMFNEAFLHFSGYTKDELAGRNAESLFTRETAKDVCDVIQGATNKGRVIKGYLAKLVGKNGQQLSVSINASVTKDRYGDTLGCLLIMRDIEKEESLLQTQKEAIDELNRTKERILSILEDTTAARDEAHKKSEELAKLYEQLKIADTKKTEFLSIVSHDLRTPLVPIIGYAEMLDSGAAGTLDEKQKQYIRSIKKESDYLLSLVESVLDVSRLETGKSLELNKQPTPVNVMVKEVLEVLEPQAQTAQVRISSDIPDDVPIILIDHVKVKRVLANLVSNSLKFTQKNGEISVTARGSDGYITVQVADNGAGIPASDLPHIFDKYYQAENPLIKAKKGVGLGMTISKQIVEAHGGKIWVESEGPGKGTKVSFTLPIAA